MSTPEGKVKNTIKSILKTHKAYWHCPVQNGMGSPSLDFVGCHAGRFFGIEAKAGSKQPTPRQLETMADMERAGGKTFLVNEFTGKQELEEWLLETSIVTK